jgi:class 3 adenylate cyclase/tetratricopeptide (TPR) repeat protein
MEGAPRAIERKVITALFCDVVGSTELGERLDPEDIDRLMSRYHALARRRIEANGGTVEKFIGDAVVGVFGAPLVHEDDPARAVRAALAIIRELSASGLGLQVRIGLQTGEAVVRVGADRTAEEGLATGDILNTAARLQGAAPPGGIAVGEPTYRLTTGDFEWTDLGDVALKGKAEPVHVWQPLRTLIGGGEITEATPFMGRGDDLAAVSRAFGRAVGAPGVELVTIVAEPGMGKSRLVREARREILSRGDATWRVGRSLPYGDGISFWALGEIVKGQAGILENDEPQAVRDKLDAAIDESDPVMRAWLRDRFAPLVGLATEAAAPPREELYAAWTRFIASLAARGPVVLVFEDLHWADHALVDFVTHLADVGEPIPLLVITTARPEIAERHPAWLDRAARSTLVQLTSLGDEAVRAMLLAALPAASDAFIAAVIERAAGSPLYAEQLAALARDQGAAGTAIDETTIPPSIRALLAARIDGLPSELKPALLDASVIGRVFWAGAVATLESADPGSVAPTLDELARRELARQVPSSMVDEAEYAFWHALLRDVAYSFLPRAARLAKHRAAAAWIAERAGGAHSDLAEIIADHLRRALELATAMDAGEELSGIRSDLADALLAAARHTMTFEPARAAKQAAEAVELLGADDPRRAGAHVLIGRAHIARAEYALAVPALDAAADAYVAHGDELAAAELVNLRVSALSNAGESARARELVQAARPVLEAHPGPGLVELLASEAWRIAGTTNLEATEAAAEATFQLAARLGLARPYKAALALGLSRTELRHPRARETLQEGIDLAVAAGDNAAAMNAQAMRADIIVEHEHTSAALAGYDAAMAFAARYGLSDAHARGSRLDVLEVSGRWDELLVEGSALRAAAIDRGDAWTALMAALQMAAVEAQRGVISAIGDDVLLEAGAVGMQPGIGANAAAVAANLRGDRDGARRIIVDTVAAIPPGGWMFGAMDLVRVALDLQDVQLAWQVLAKSIPEDGPNIRHALTRLATALILEAEGDFGGALDRFVEMNALFERLGWPPTQVIALAGLGRTRIALGDVPAGLDDLHAARSIAAGLGMRPMLASIEGSIAEAMARVPDVAAQAALRPADSGP